MWKWLKYIFSGMETFDAGLSLAERFGDKVPRFLYRHDYYFEEVNKKVFIKSNGDGIVVCSCDLYVIRPEKVEHFVRTFDISDARKDTKFPKFKSIKINKNRFFNDCVIWYKSDKDIISSIEEYKKDFSAEEIRKVSDGKLIGIRFLVDKNKLESKCKYRIIYGYSIPGLFPILNGKHDKSECSSKDYKYTTSMAVKHMAKKLRLSVYFEHGICIKEAPAGNAIKVTDNQTTPSSKCEVRDNILYTKYLYEIKHPEKYNAIQINWKLK